MSEPDTVAQSEPSDNESEMLRLLRRGRVGMARVRRHKDKYWELDFSHPGGMALPRKRKYCTSPSDAVRTARRIIPPVALLCA